jgi:hypothetical protein
VDGKAPTCTRWSCVAKAAPVFPGGDRQFGGLPKEDEYRELYGHLERLPIPAVAAMMEDL